MNYDIWIVKASRQPVLYLIDLSYNDAIDMATTLYECAKVLHKNKLAESGISIQVVRNDHYEYCSSIEIGGFPDITVSFQLGAY